MHHSKTDYKNHCLSLAFIKEFSKNREDFNKKKITSQTKSTEISKIISERLLENIQKQLTL
ncbi:hypothetical protein SAMN05216556_10695 [Aequorivita viscosa]|uniref:Uncharacterized protein n=1 Tax=Aequorivita viscosa TaxID=797419 RepID=A0A1M6DQ88_9FLAO|nr:hypothetical protein SAMN05216556_10695 [Aequorivita viscosa]SHI75362.1 hypothetical protein SAMN04487908_10577 [Aequorivita viscosa]